MLYNFTIFTKGGIILWNKENEKLQDDPVSALIRDILLQEKHNQSAYNSKDQKYVLQWAQDNVRNIYFVTVVPKNLPAPYVSTLLERTQAKFAQTFPNCEPFQDYDSFTEVFDKLFKKTITDCSQQNSAPRSFAETEKGKKVTQKETKKARKKREREEREEEERKNAPVPEPEPEKVETVSKLDKLKPRRKGGKMRTGPPASAKKKNEFCNQIKTATTSLE
mmetsp:Transcript_68159/g.102775  ORF Transcript_68159/g.102775 Transcript_68159/m.102775 type:complete len:221 (-) Transcript_68159:1092-1754(-)